jgi:8-oxo-dGTP diphosphatase
VPVYKNMNRGIVALVFRCKITGGDLTTTDEASAFRWATEPELPTLMPEAYAIRVQDALHEPSTTAIRPHDGTHLV